MSGAEATDGSLHSEHERLTMTLEAHIPVGPIADKWDEHKFSIKLVNPANKRRFHVLVVGTGLAGASAAASLAELGYQVTVVTFHDSPRRAHSIAAQGGINAAKNYKNDGDSVQRLFYDTVKGGDYRSREANVYRLAQLSVNIIDQCAAQGVPFAREYGGLLDNRSFGGAQVSRTFYARGQTGQQLLLGAYQALAHQIALGAVTLRDRTEMLDLVVKDGRAVGITCRDLVTGEVFALSGHAVVLATGGYGNVFFLSTNAMNCNVTAAWRASKKGAYFANPCYTQIHPTCIPASDDFQSKLTLMSESLRNDGRIWVPATMDDTRPPEQIPESERDYFLERRYPAFGNLVPRDVASRAAKREVDAGRGVGPKKNGVYLDFAEAIGRLGEHVIRERYSNLFEMYDRITGEDPYRTPMRIYPAVHYTMGGLWVDYNLQSNLPGLFVLGEANFSDHGANRLGASALMQGLADGYFVLPATIGDYLAPLLGQKPVPTDDPVFHESGKAVDDGVRKLLSTKGTKSVDHYHRELGKVVWDNCGMGRTEQSLTKALSEIPAIREEFHKNVRVLGEGESFNQSLERAGRVSDFLEFAELMCLDALHRKESCGGHFREEYQTPDGEALRDDENFAYVGAWEFTGVGNEPVLHKEPLVFENVHLATRSYK
ncbi:MAG: succinate dehydrogenase / fumarate reductase, flavoprotein subunit [Actinomycetota bacterium]|nr:succinate dehydrogenase / fumarate reductase, flavoprotein subunit [Actinomycetota bacterium]